MNLILVFVRKSKKMFKYKSNIRCRNLELVLYNCERILLERYCRVYKCLIHVTRRDPAKLQRMYSSKRPHSKVVCLSEHFVKNSDFTTVLYSVLFGYLTMYAKQIRTRRLKIENYQHQQELSIEEYVTYSLKVHQQTHNLAMRIISDHVLLRKS